MPIGAPLLRKLLQLARERGWSPGDLADHLGVHRTLIVKIQSGERRMSIDFLSGILTTFRSDPVLPDLVLDYLAVDLAADRARRARERTAELLHPPTDLPERVRARLEQYAQRFSDRHYYDGRGLFILGSPKQLGPARDYLLREASFRGIATRAIPGNSQATDRIATITQRTPLLVIDRIEFASPDLLDLLYQRTHLLKPVVCGSSKPLDALPHAALRRALETQCRLVVLGDVKASRRTSRIPTHA